MIASPSRLKELGSGLLRNLRSGLLLFGLRRPSPERFARGFDQVALLVALNLVVWAVLDTAHAEQGAELMLDGLYGWGFYLLLGLFGCALVARAHCRETDTRALLLPALAVSPFVLAAFWLLSDLPKVGHRPALARSAAILYLILLGIRLLQAAYGSARAKATLTAVVCIILGAYGFHKLDLDTRLWLTDDSGDAQEEEADAEALFYDQPARLIAAAEHMAPRHAGEPNAFYVGFAGDGAHSIFKREALYSQQVLGQHFGSAERSVELINDDGDRETYPLASASGLRQELKLIASHMDTDEDVLVLMLTSHGSQDGLAVANGNLELAQLGPAELQQALDESGIKWRIVIVSACYAGVFIDALKSADTLVMTAADATHSSFGCDDERDLTYFGEALLRDALPRASSLEEAFKSAARIIDRRETAEHLVHSNPQMFVGLRMHEHLAQLELEARARGHGTIVARHTAAVHSPPSAFARDRSLL